MNLNAEGFITTSKQVVLKPYQPRSPLPISYLTDAELQGGVGGVMMVDVECYFNYFLILFLDCATQKCVRFVIDRNTGECLNERKLSWMMFNYTTVGFNSYKFDLQLIWYAFINQDAEALKKLANALTIGGMYTKQAQQEFSYQTFKTAHIDLIDVCPLQGSLKLYGGRLHAPRIQDLPFDHLEHLSEWQKPIVDDYCLNDLQTTKRIFDFSNERLKLRAEISQEYNIDVMSKSDAQIAEAVISKELRGIAGSKLKAHGITSGTTYTYDVPNYIQYVTPSLQGLLEKVKASRFVVNDYGYLDTPEILKECIVKVGDLECKFGIGGLHSCESEIAYLADDEYIIVDKDVTSYYPEIILTCNLYPEHLGPAFLDVFRGFKNKRVEAKKNKQFTKDKGLKIFINGASGKFNNKHSNLYSPKCYFQMTITGQLSILMLAEMIVCNGMKVISANTDGIVIYCKKTEYDKLEYWIKYWSERTKFNTEETQYKAYYARDVNAYFALKLDGSVKVKGPYSEVGSQSGTQLDNNPITLICSDAIKSLLSKGVPVEQTIRECRNITRFITLRNVKSPGAHKDGYYLGKVVRWYYAKNIVGTINTVGTNNKVPMTEGAKPCMDLPDEFPNDIDYKKYIKITTEMLYDINYLKRPKQITFF
jgi:hypothetical protein